MCGSVLLLLLPVSRNQNLSEVQRRHEGACPSVRPDRAAGRSQKINNQNVFG